MQPNFIFGGNTGVSTPQELAKRREVVDALIASSMNRAPQTFGEGLTAIGMALAGRIKDKRLKAEEAQAREAAQGQFSAITGQLSAPQGQAMPAVTTGPQVIADETMAALGKPQIRTEMDRYKDSIAGIESGGNYSAIGPTNPNLGRALGKYQVMEANIGPWSREVLGREITPEEFLQRPELQDAIFEGKFGQYVQQYGPEGAAQAWFGGEGGVGQVNRQDALGTSIGSYGNQFMSGLGDMAALADNPYLTDSQRSVVTSLLNQQMQPQPTPMEARAQLLDLALKEAELARAQQPQGQTEYAQRETAARNLGLTPDDPAYREFVLTGKLPEQAPQTDVERRAVEAQQFSLKPDDPAYQSFVLTGRMPREDQTQLTATDKKAILEADDAVLANQTAVDMLTQIITPDDTGVSLNDRAGYGIGADWQAWAARNDPTGLFDAEKGQATTDLQNIVLNQALGQLKATFGGAPTEGERKILVDLQASVDKTPQERASIIQRAIELATIRLNANKKRAEELRGGTFYQPAGDQSPADLGLSDEDLQFLGVGQ